MDAERELDVVVFGATGFAGRLVAEYLAEHAPDDVRIGLAGRSRARLEQVRGGLGPGAAESRAARARSARVVATTVGPYRPRGLPLVGVCAEAGTDYVDLSGEVLFERDSIDRYHETAARTGARIVHGCGFDSIPSDLGVHLLHETVAADDGGDLEDTTLIVTRLRGGFSGGALSSIVEPLDEGRADPSLRGGGGGPDPPGPGPGGGAH